MASTNYAYDEPHRWGYRTFLQTSDVPNIGTLKATGQFLPITNHELIMRNGVSPVVESEIGPVSHREVSTVPDHLAVNVSQGYARLANLTAEVPSYGYQKEVVTRRILQKARNIKLDLGVTLGEFGETAAFTATAMTRVARSYRALRKGHVSKALSILTGRKNQQLRDIPGTASDAWLMYQFALNPLLSDVHSVAKLLEGQLLNPNNEIVLYASKTDSFNTELTYDANYPINYTKYGINTNGKLKTTAKVYIRVSDPTLYTMEQLGITNPVATAWELVPFSFVVDWFAPVGEFFRNIFPPQGLEFVTGYTYTKVHGSSQAWYDKEPHPAYPDNLGVHTKLSAWDHWKKREHLGAFPEPSYTIPDLSLSKGKIASGMALLYKVLIEGDGKPPPRRYR